MTIDIRRIEASVRGNKLNLSYGGAVKLTDEDIKPICDFLKEHPEITRLELESNAVSDEGAQLLAAITSINSLNVNNNNIGDVGVAALAGNTSLNLLEIQNNKFSDEGTQLLAANRNLTTLDVSRNKISCEGIKALAANSTLISLSACWNYLGDEGIKPLLANTSLTDLDVRWGNTLTDESNKAIELMLERNRDLSPLREKCLTLAQGYNDQNSFFKKEAISKEVIDLISAHTAIVHGV